MLEWIWGCMVLTFKVGVGSLCWTLGFWAVIGVIALIVFAIKALMD